MDGKICEVTDSGGVDDKSFNATAWDGAQEAAKTLNTEATYLESKQQTDYEKTINEFVKSDCALIVTAAFLVRTARREGVDRLALFDLGGVLARSKPERWLSVFASRSPDAE